MSANLQFWNHIRRSASLLLAAVVVHSCSTTRHVRDGELLLDHARVEFVAQPDSSAEPLLTHEFTNYLRQKPNARALGLWKWRLMTYSLSGRDSTK